MITTILMIVGVFAGIALCMATLYSVAQAMLREGPLRLAHLVQVLAILVVMGALLEREVTFARTAAVPLFLIALWVTWVERGWYRIFPVLVQVFAVLLIAGYVAFNA